ncbi:TadE/TadG family type IV pilus assembly protein [Rhodovibrionaceae bacterium A322]
MYDKAHKPLTVQNPSTAVLQGQPEDSARAGNRLFRGVRGHWTSAGSLRRDEKGVTAVAFALGLPLIFLTMTGLLELCFILLVGTLMEGGLREAARFGITGQEPNADARTERVIEIVESHTMGLVDLEAADISFKSYASFGAVGEPEPFTDSNRNGRRDNGENYTDVNNNGRWDADQGAEGLGGAEEVVLYSLDYNWPLLTGFLDHLIGSGGAMPLRASVLVRNEPYDLGG